MGMDEAGRGMTKLPAPLLLTDGVIAASEVADVEERDSSDALAVEEGREDDEMDSPVLPPPPPPDAAPAAANRLLCTALKTRGCAPGTGT